MILYVNSKNEIKDVDFTEDENLTPIEVDDNTFKGWSVAKICCHKVYLRKGKYVGFTPYVDIKIVEHIDRLALDTQKNTDNIATLEATVVNNI